MIGAEDERAQEVMSEVYRPLYLNASPLLFTTRRTAEIIKYAANAFLATKITFINEIADLCEKVGGNVQDVARGIGLDNRIGSKFLHAGPGYGGSCFPKDTIALMKTAQDVGAPAKIVEAVVAVNDARKHAMAEKVIKALGGSAKGKTVAVLGLTFKPNTDDMREAPSLVIVPALKEAGAKVNAHDPQAMEEAAELLPGVEMCKNPYDAAHGADALVIVTEWDAYRALDLMRLKQALKTPSSWTSAISTIPRKWRRRDSATSASAGQRRANNHAGGGIVGAAAAAAAACAVLRFAAVITAATTSATRNVQGLAV